MNDSDFKSGFKRFLELETSAIKTQTEDDSCSSVDGDCELDLDFLPTNKCKASLIGSSWPDQVRLILTTQLDLLNQDGSNVHARCCEDKFVLDAIDGFISASIQQAPQKDATKSAEYRRLGNEACDENQFENASYLYTLAILYAPDQEETVLQKPEVSSLALAYEKRSALFFQLDKWSGCLVDIELALDAGYSDHPSVRALMIRKVECLISLGRFTEARRLWAEEPILSTPNPDGFEEDRAQKRRLKFIDFGTDFDIQPKLTTTKHEINPLIEIILSLVNVEQYEPSCNLASLSAKLKLNSNEDFASESHSSLITNTEIQAGDILAVELPYLTALYKEYEFFFCHHCCRPLETTSKTTNDDLMISGPVVPCTKCTRVLYCSPKCRTLSWAIYHRHECAILPVLHQTGVGHLAMRILISTGLDTIRRATQCNMHSECHMQDATDVVSLYAQLYNVSISQKSATQNFLQYSITTSLLVQLVKRCKFFQDISSLKDTKLAGEIILRHMLQIAANGRPVSRMAVSAMPERFREIQIADALYPVTSLMKRTDNPNVVVTFVQGSGMVVRASRKIGPGEEVLMPNGQQRICKPNQYDSVLDQTSRMESRIKEAVASGIPVPASEMAQLAAQMVSAGFQNISEDNTTDPIDRLCDGQVEDLEGEGEKHTLQLMEHIYGGSSLELLCALIVLSDQYYDQILTGDRKLVVPLKELTEKAIQLLMRLGLVGPTYRMPYTSDLLCDESLNFFVTEHRRLVKRLQLIEKEKEVKSMDEQDVPLN